ncbi:unnamed protein product [Caenorhabditis auriculariae]|uniref:Uncharacterized protein n=1 Tax=Caenorhabditis auriculariae TaxID=2777116 RepID=A0A8S1HBW9_9PELO|nr:unnamed protein product [Caenorhabditis auriculariae]
MDDRRNIVRRANDAVNESFSALTVDAMNFALHRFSEARKNWREAKASLKLLEEEMRLALSSEEESGNGNGNGLPAFEVRPQVENGDSSQEENENPT